MAFSVWLYTLTGFAFEFSMQTELMESFTVHLRQVKVPMNIIPINKSLWCLLRRSWCVRLLQSVPFVFARYEI